MTNPPLTPRPFKSLSAKVVTWVLAGSILFTVAMVLVLVGSRHLEERAAAIGQLRFAADSYSSSLANSLWDLDMDSARLQIEALARFPMIGEVRLSSSIGQQLRASRPGTSASASAEPDAAAPGWQQTLHRPGHPEQVVGELRLYVDEAELWHHLQADALRILMAEAVKGILLGLLVIWLISRLVTRHVLQLSRQLDALPPGGQCAQLTLQRQPQRHEDELDHLCDAINQRNQRLSEFIRSQQEMEAELRHHRDGLSQMVADRTGSLERLQAFHSIVIMVLNNCINLPPEQAQAAITDCLAAFGMYFEADDCLLFCRDDTSGDFRLAHAWPPQTARQLPAGFSLAPHELPLELHGGADVAVWSSLPGQDSAEHGRIATLLGGSPFSLAAVVTQGRIAGWLCLSGRAIAKDSEDAALLQMAARVTANMLNHTAQQIHLLQTQQALQHANGELYALSRHDFLTGLANRRHFDEIKGAEYRRALRTGAGLSLLMCDMDEFKRYNDAYGHGQGDICLKQFAGCLQQLFGRAGELAVRLGGEEFAVVLPNTSRDDALLLAERLRKAVWDLHLPHGASSIADRVTVSIGVATLIPGLHRDFDAILDAADAALYQAKGGGRNRVALADEARPLSAILV
jgi:diguanylate cyclase (GGDEF)-like protein